MSNPPTGPASAPKNQLTILWFLVLIGIAGIAVAVLGRLFQMREADPEPAVEESAVLGRSFSSWKFLPLYGSDEPISSDAVKGKVVLLNFWATWCPPCRKELPQIAELAKEFAANEDFRLVTVSCGQNDFDGAKRESVQFLKKRNLEVPTYFDPKATVLREWQAWTGDSGIPVTFVLDRDGRIRGSWVGADSKYTGQMRRRVEEILNQ